MLITLNGAKVEVAEGTTVSGLLKAKNILPERVVVELNRAIVPSGGWDAAVLGENDEIEVVSFVGGGSPWTTR